VPWTIQEVSGPAAFGPIPLATSPSTGSTGPLNTAGGYEYKINGTNPILVHGFITVHP